MRPIWRIFLFILKLLNWWLFKIPCRFSFLSLVGYNFLIYLCFGRWSIEAVQDSLGTDTIQFYFFQVLVSLPMFISFICCWADSKMISSNFRKSNFSALDRAIEYRDGQIGVQSPQKAFETLKNTISLDMMRTNSDNPGFDKALQGFNTLHGNSTPQKVYKELTSED